MTPQIYFRTTMSSSITDPKVDSTSLTSDTATTDSKGKGKAPVEDVSMNVEEEEAEEDDDDDDDADEEEDDDDEDPLVDIDPSVIVPGRRTRGVRVDYTSNEALAKAGLSKADLEADEDDDVKMD